MLSPTSPIAKIAPLIATQKQLVTLTRGRVDAIVRANLAREIFNTQVSIGQLLDNRICLPAVPELGSTLSGDDEVLLRPLSLEHSAQVTLPPDYDNVSFTMHAGSNLGGLPTGTIIDYCNSYYMIEGNDFTGYRLSEMAGV